MAEAGLHVRRGLGSSGPPPPEPTTSCTGDSSRSAIAAVAPLPTERWSAANAPASSTSVRPWAAAVSTWASRPVVEPGPVRAEMVLGLVVVMVVLSASVSLPWSSAQCSTRVGSTRRVAGRQRRGARAGARSGSGPHGHGLPSASLQGLEVLPELALEDEPAELAVLLLDGGDQVRHRRRADPSPAAR